MDKYHNGHLTFNGRENAALTQELLEKLVQERKDNTESYEQTGPDPRRIGACNG